MNHRGITTESDCIDLACLQALTKMAADNDNRVVCPRTKEIYTLDEAEKVFVM